MRIRLTSFVLFAILLTFVSSVASAQNLADLARASREKKMKVMKQQSVRIYTNDNMPRRPANEGATAAAGMSVSPPSSTGESVPPSSPDITTAPAGAEEDERQTKEFWQGRFKTLRQRLADTEELQRLAEDELSLLQIQQARELSPDPQGGLEAKVKAARAEVEAKRLQIAKLRKELEELEKEFKDSGAPTEWSKTD